MPLVIVSIVSEGYYKWLTLYILGGLAIVVAYISIRNLYYLWYLTFAVLPLSLTLEEIIGGASVAIPSDLAAILFLGVVLLRAKQWKRELLQIFRHPLMWILSGYVLWIAFTTLFSVDVVVSLKALLSFTWYLVGFLVFSAIVFSRRAYLFSWLFGPVLPLLVLLLWTLGNHAMLGFSFKGSYKVVYPFFRERTIYAAYLSVMVFILLLGSSLAQHSRQKFGALAVGILTFVALILSYTRGAWLGTLAAGYLIIVVRTWRLLKKLYFLLGIGLVFFISWIAPQIFKELSKKATVTRKVTIAQHFTSLLRPTDVSSKERLNRWVAAYHMILDRPWTGFGMGNFTKHYAPYQSRKFKTWISTNRGETGSAHSEFLLAAAETGVIGGLFVLLWFVVSTLIAARGYLTAQDKAIKQLYLIAMTALVAYYVHGIVNNFLDHDKMIIPVMILNGLIISLDRFHRQPLGKKSV